MITKTISNGVVFASIADDTNSMSFAFKEDEYSDAIVEQLFVDSKANVIIQEEIDKSMTLNEAVDIVLKSDLSELDTKTMGELDTKLSLISDVSVVKEII